VGEAQKDSKDAASKDSKSSGEGHFSPLSQSAALHVAKRGDCPQNPWGGLAETVAF